MQKKSKDNKNKVEDNDTVMQEFSDFAVESLEQTSIGDLETIEFYAQKLRSHIRTDADVFRLRFQKGYEALLEALANEKKQSL